MNLDVLMTTVPGDIHAAAVAVALERHGHGVMRWYPAAYPLANDVSFRLSSSAGARLMLRLAGGRVLSFPDDRVRTFWYRRQGFPTPSRKLHPADREPAMQACQRATDSALAYVSNAAGFSVNPYPAARAAEQSKMLQLQVAAACGFRCPETLISNSPEDITEFLQARRGETIFKPLRIMTWETETGTATSYTAPVTIEDLPSEEILRSSPGIFQEKIPKRHELRVTVMGSCVLAARLDSQSLDAASDDWRALGPKVPVAPIELPADIRARCVALLRRLGVVFGCIDLIVTPAGEHVFLEINQQGQFLWLEERAPSMPLLDTFAQFLASADRDFAGPARPARVSFESVREEAYEMLERDIHEHSPPLERQDYTFREQPPSPSRSSE